MKGVSHKQLWRKDGTVDYIFIEARPPRKRMKEDARAQVSVESLPAGDLGACDAIQALQEASLSNRTNKQARAFYATLREFAEAWKASD